MVPKVQITSCGLAIEAGPDMHCYAQSPSPDPAQQWQLVYYPEKDAVAIVIAMSGNSYALSAPPNEEFPRLRPFLWDDSCLWRVPHLLGNTGIATVRAPGFCLTWQGGSGWVPGTRLQDDHGRLPALQIPSAGRASRIGAGDRRISSRERG